MGDDYLRAKVFRDRLSPGDWRVECEIEDGGIEVAIFSGPNARERAIRHADRHYGDFEEVILASY
jgi:ABC-type phosphonate transport system ATPase subunit